MYKAEYKTKKMPLSDLALRRAKATGRTYELADGRGLGARVSPKGLITFQYRFRLAGRPQRMDLGHYPAMSLAEAREAHFNASRLVGQGTNPIRAREDRERAERDANTVDQLAHEFLNRRIRTTHKDPSQAEAILRVNVLPFIGRSKITEVRRRDIVQLLERIVDRGAPVMANRTASLTKQMFSFAVARGLLDAHPIAELTRTSIGGPEKPRSTYLSYQQIWVLWRNLAKVDFSDSLKIAIKLLLVTGQRRGELIGGMWSHVNLDKGLWIIPVDLAKNGKQHVVHLTPLAVNLFQSLRSLAGDSPFIIPSHENDEPGPMTPRALNKAIDRHLKELGIGKFSPHVLRHTFSTQISALGVAPHVVEKLLNHSFSGMLAVYNHQEYFRERQEALAAWSKRLLVVTSANESDIPQEPNLVVESALAHMEAAIV